ncbi:restriction endonuclease PLD domain-containing protein [Vibrio rotiferianus]|uniref:restriction endonuclease PLD domain-containing protein n=1 Tax=Vibrio rotiferianus TaxID=190895 RepID=UPI0038B4001C
MLYFENLYELIFNRHKGNNIDELVIISGYLGPKPVQDLVNLPLKTTVYYGMYGSDKIDPVLHNTLMEIERNSNNIKLRYCNPGIHTKCYIWKKNGKIVDVLSGSANFSSKGLRTANRELLNTVNKESFLEVSKYETFISNISRSPCDIKIEFRKKSSNTKNVHKYPDNPSETCKISLLEKKTGKPHKASGLNWGHGKGNTQIDDAYLQISAENVDSYPLLFPLKQNKPLADHSGKKQRQNDVIEILWDDGTVMEALFEQYRKRGEIKYPKAISSAPDKSIMGQYLRRRLGISNSEFVTLKHLEEYGRTDIDVSMTSDGVYLMNFSINKQK